jgi:hypothetical protein
MDDIDVEACCQKAGADLHETPGVPGCQELRAWYERSDVVDLRFEHGPRQRRPQNRIQTRTPAALIRSREDPEPEFRHGAEDVERLGHDALGVLEMAGSVVRDVAR